jgi:histone acetyltransferase (RNA polymerase elongator complex component)
VQEYQNKKELRLGTKLLKAAEKFAKMQKAKKIRLVSTEYAYKFYIRKGYTDMGYMMKSL